MWDCQIGFSMEITLMDYSVHMRVHNSVKNIFINEISTQKKISSYKITRKTNYKKIRLENMCECVCMLSLTKKNAKSC